MVSQDLGRSISHTSSIRASRKQGLQKIKTQCQASTLNSAGLAFSKSKDPVNGMMRTRSLRASRTEPRSIEKVKIG